MSHKDRNRKKKQNREQTLERENELLRLEVEYLKKAKSFSDGFGWLSRKVQAALSLELKEKFRLKDVLKIVGIPESSYHYHVKRLKMTNPDQELEDEIQSIFEENDGNYGYRWIRLELKNKKKSVNHKKVQRIMRKLGLKAKKFTRKSQRYSSYKGTVGTVTKNRIKQKSAGMSPVQYRLHISQSAA